MVYNYFIVNPNCVFIKGFLLSYVGPTVYNDVFAGTGDAQRCRAGDPTTPLASPRRAW
jgi:hypothetical protein